MKPRPHAEAAFSDRQGLSILEAATVIGVGRSKVYELLRSKQLAARKVGRRTIILREDALAFLRNTQPVG